MRSIAHRGMISIHHSSFGRRFKDVVYTVAYFARDEAQAVRQGGVRVFVRKIMEYAANTLRFIVLLLIRALRPLVVVRFGQLRVDRIGHFAAETELYLCRRDLGLDVPRSLDLFYYVSHVFEVPPPANRQLTRMFERKIRVSQKFHRLDALNWRLPGHQRHLVSISSDRDIHGWIPRTRAHLAFTAQEEAQGQAELRRMGLPDQQPFICIHARDSAYLQATHSHLNTSYHNFRDFPVSDLLPAAGELADRGNFIVRLGAVVAEALPPARPEIIDYARRYRTDFLDIYLCAKCRFFLGTDCGLAAVPMIFRRPIANVNCAILEHAPHYGARDLFIPKKLWLRGEKRFMKFREILQSGAGRYVLGEQFEQAGIETVNNSPEEIQDLAVEMDERLSGAWQTTDEDEARQRRFWALFRPNDLQQVFWLRIGTRFLRQHAELL